MARRGRQCFVEGCWRNAGNGKVVCKDHEQTALGKQSIREVVKLEREVRALMNAKGADERKGAAKLFRQRVERGEFATLFSGKFGELLRDLGQVQEMVNDIGALRLAVIRLMLEEDDPAKLATALSKVVNATANALRTQKMLTPERDPNMEALDEAFARLHADHEEVERRNAERRELGDGETVRRLEGQTEGDGKPVVYGNELERLFWEEDDPRAYHEYLRLAIEKEHGK